ncbi:MAG: menaquinone biosynthesis protein [Acidobacteria bacterium]|nr:menaquinone biosynthesis protein [Acidobacteriota bacterium]MCA1642722.1 menaquinone biosynthesis protein [Acidobacteriota bacterium]
MGIILIANEAGAAPRLAASSYLNSAPLIWSYTRGSKRSRAELFTDAAPARCARMLARGEVDAALVPVIEYQRLPEVAVVPGVCVGARRAVRSVVLATRRADLREVRRVALDESSRTSAALVRVIFREFYDQEIETTTRHPDVRSMLDEADAALIIGDPAMTFAREEGLHVHDLASLWREHTGLGFVFAMWMAHESDTEAVRAADFAGARDEGVAHLEEIIEEYERELLLPREELRSYLTENVCFELDDEMRAGLELFFRLSHRHGLIERARPLRLFDVSDG